MITAGINILLVSVLILIIGLINPKWLLVWIDKPGRMPIILIASVLFMIGMTLFGEGTKRKQEVVADKPAEQQQAEPKQVAPKKTAIPSAQELLK